MMTFQLTIDQERKLNIWKQKIKDEFGEYGNFTYSFSPTGIGTVVTVYSSILDKTLNLTNYDEW